MSTLDSVLDTRQTASPDGERVTFSSGQETMVGRVFAPAFGDSPAPAVVITGPMTHVKEMQPLQYAHRLARNGLLALIYDPRSRGESSGEPRCMESPSDKVADLRAAAAYLADRSDVDPERLAVVGICFGGNYAMHAAVEEPLLRTVAVVTPHVRNAEADELWLGGADEVAARLARGREAKEHFDATGEVEYVPAVSALRTDVGMPGQLPWQWYQPYAERGSWDNRHAVLGDAELLTYESLSVAARLTKPLLMIHGDNCALPDQAARHFAVVPTNDKLHLRPSTPHLDFYDQPAAIDPAVTAITDWFSRHLGPPR